MGNSTHRVFRRLAAGSLAATVALAWGCAGSLRTSPSVVGSGSSYQYFVPSDPDDAWSRKIRGWQLRERTASPPDVASPGDLHAKYRAFRSERKRAIAQELAAWIQNESRQHYIEDGPVDHWATFEETLRSNGDDCDGLELLVYYLLRDLGFSAEEVFRAVVYRKSDGQHHMVTLWFEDPDDPWIIDPTGAMTSGMPRMSEVPTWVPLKVFSDERDYTVRRTVATR